MNNASLPAPGIPHGLAVLTKKDAGRLAMRGLQALQLGLPTAAQQAAENFFCRYPDWFLFRVCRCGPIPQALIENYQDRWNWRERGRSHLDFLQGLSGNIALPWSEALIERYRDRWDWGWLSWNTALPWSVTLIERYVHKWTFGRGLVSILLREPGCLSLTPQQTEKLTRQCLAAGRSADTVSAFAEICLTRRNINRLVSYCQALAAE